MDNNIRTIASLITEDPNISASREEILTEWGWTRGYDRQFNDPLEKRFAALLDKGHIQQLIQTFGISAQEAAQRAMGDLMMEFRSFRQHYKLQMMAAVEAFEYFKKNRRLPPQLERPENLDRIGGKDFRPEGI